MVSIASAQLSIGPVGTDHPGRRLVCIEFDLTVDGGDPTVGHELVATIALRPVDRHDAPTPPPDAAVFSVTERFVAAAGTVHHVVRHEVDRVDLDVEADWWATDNEGRPVPIAEWLDHLVGHISLRHDDAVVAVAATPTVTGSWGALGHD